MSKVEIKRFGLYVHKDEQGEYFTIADLQSDQPVIDIKTLKIRPAYDGDLADDLVHHLNNNFKLIDNRVECPHCKSKNTHFIYRPEVYEFNFVCRDCDRGFNG